ncbi:MAG: hypothetical protein AB2L21_10385 [Anaerolineaceae bacterium]
MENDIDTYRKALDDFRHARSKAALQRFWAGLQGKSMDLLPFDEISTKLHAVSQTDKGLQNVKLVDIIGSVGRHEDFDRNFLPLRDSDIHRWASVKAAMTSPVAAGVPPVSLYKMGDAYFVLDGNHRVSIAKAMGMEEIEAYVTEIKTKVPISSSITPAELVSKAAYVDFLDQTHLDQILPGVDFSLNLTQNYDLLKQHISVHRYYMGIEQGREINYQEAVLDWYDKVYAPVAEIIFSSGLKEEYQDLTVTDLYLWILDHQSMLSQELGMPIRTENAAAYMAVRDGKTAKAQTSRGEQHMEETVSSDKAAEFADGDDQQHPKVDCLFRDILVALGDNEESWGVIDQAIMIDHCSEGNIRGLHVVDPKDQRDESVHRAMQERFEKRLAETGHRGKLLIVEGDITTTIYEHSLLNDILVLKLTYPPTGGIIDRLSSGIAAILRKCLRPILVMKEKAIPVTSILLVYDGSPKSKEALYVAAYLAARFGIKLDVFTLDTGIPDIEAEASYAKTYLRKLNLNFTYTIKKGEDFTKEVLAMTNELHSSTIVLGGYGSNSLRDRFLGTAVDLLLEQSEIPILICQ